MRRFPLLTVLLLAALLAGCGGDDGEENGNGGESAGGEAVELVATDFAFDPADVSVDAGEATFTLSNEGEFPHALAFDDLDAATGNVVPGGSGEVTVELEPGSYAIYCPVGNHRDQGMEGTLVVGGASTAGGGTTDKSESDRDDPYGYG